MRAKIIGTGELPDFGAGGGGEEKVGTTGGGVGGTEELGGVSGFVGVGSQALAGVGGTGEAFGGVEGETALAATGIGGRELVEFWAGSALANIWRVKPAFEPKVGGKLDMLVAGAAGGTCEFVEVEVFSIQKSIT